MISIMMVLLNKTLFFNNSNIQIYLFIQILEIAT